MDESNRINKTAILYLSHIAQSGIFTNFENIKSDCNFDFDIFFLCDNSKGKFTKYRDRVEFFSFTFRDFLKLKYSNKSDVGYREEDRTKKTFRKSFNFQPGNNELSLLWFYQNNPQFHYYWLIEYDVRFSGSWNHLFSHFQNSDADLLGTTFSRYEESQNWPHWDGLDFAGHEIERNELLRGFFPIYRMSNRALRQLHADYSTGVSGHMEGLVPTLLQHAGLVLEDIGGNSEFSKRENLNRFYRNTRTSNPLSPGTLVFRPSMDRPGKEKNLLWHPVKHRPAWKRALSFCGRSARNLARSFPYK